MIEFGPTIRIHCKLSSNDKELKHLVNMEVNKLPPFVNLKPDQLACRVIGAINKVDSNAYVVSIEKRN